MRVYHIDISAIPNTSKFNLRERPTYIAYAWFLEIFANFFSIGDTRSLDRNNIVQEIYLKSVLHKQNKNRYTINILVTKTKPPRY